MSAFQAGLALVSAIIGGCIVGIPYAMFQTGITMGLVLNILFALITIYSGNLYLKCKDMAPMYVESLLNELSYVVVKRIGIFIVATAVVASGAGAIMIYLIVFGDISASLAKKAYGDDSNVDNFLTKRPVYVVTLALLMLPLCLKKQLAEMKFVALTLFLAVALFVFLFLV